MNQGVLSFLNDLVIHDILFAITIFMIVFAFVAMRRTTKDVRKDLSITKKELSRCIESRLQFIEILERNHLIEKGEMDV